jgi:hypothetical protein
MTQKPKNSSYTVTPLSNKTNLALISEQHQDHITKLEKGEGELTDAMVAPSKRAPVCQREAGGDGTEQERGREETPKIEESVCLFAACLHLILPVVCL